MKIGFTCSLIWNTTTTKEIMDLVQQNYEIEYAQQR